MAVEVDLDTNARKRSKPNYYDDPNSLQRNDPAAVTADTIANHSNNISNSNSNSNNSNTMAHYHIPYAEILPVYKYNTAHKSKSWDEMIALFEQFGEREGHGNVEMDDPLLNRVEEKGMEEGDAVAKKEDDKEDKRENASNDNDSKGNSTDFPLNSSSSITNDDADDNDESLMLRSWVRQVRWVIRAEGLGQDDKFPQRSIASASSKQKQNVGTGLERCDSENVTAERLAQLEGMPTFPLVPYKNTNNNDGSNPRPAFQKWLDDLMHYRAKHSGDCNVPLKYTRYPGLGNFVNRQRTEYRKLQQGKASSMTTSKIQQLDQVNFVWSIREGGHASWESRLGELHNYLRVNGHTNVPKNYPPNPSLGYWVNEQRFQYRRWINDKSSYMTQSKMMHLNALNFKWSLRESKRPWSEWMEELRGYKLEHGDLNVPLKYERNVPLGSFVNNQRSEYRRYVKNTNNDGKNSNSSMTEERIRELEGMGFMWSVRDGRTPWNVRLKELREYKKRYGNCDVPNNWTKNRPLSHWVSKQRQQYKLYNREGGGTSHLTEERVGQLNELGFDWRYPDLVVPKNVLPWVAPPPGGGDGELTTAAITVAANATFAV